MVTTKGIKTALEELIALQAYATSRALPRQRKASGTLTGERRTKRFGHGMDFAEFRHYQAGDDVRAIDWRVTARSGKTHIRVYREERERPVFIVVDQSPNMQFGTRRQFKSVQAAKIAALLAWAALQNGERVGGQVSGVTENKMLSPKTGKRGVLQLLSALTAELTSDSMQWDVVLSDLRQQLKPGSLIILISDFYELGEHARQHLQTISQHNDLLLIHISDPLEQQAPSTNRYLVTDGKQELVLDTSDAALCAAYSEQFQQRFDQLKNFCEQYGINFRTLLTSDDLI